MRDIIIYVGRWWEKYLSKRSLIKKTCSWRVNLLYYYYTVILFLCHVFSFAFWGFVFPLLHWSIPEFWIRTYFFKIKNFRRIFTAFCVGWTNLIYSLTQMYFYLMFLHFNTPFFIILQYHQSKREILSQKKKQYSVNLHDFFFVFYVWWTYFLWSSIFIKVVSQWI